MKKVLVAALVTLSLAASSYFVAANDQLTCYQLTARRGCCSHHRGVSGCTENGDVICNDGTLSPTCTC